MIWLVNIISTEYNSNGELSDPLSDSQNRGLTLVWLVSVKSQSEYWTGQCKYFTGQCEY